MHLFNIVAVFLIVTMVGVEFSVSALYNPIAWQLTPEAQWAFLGPLAKVLGRVMPVWYAVGMALLAAETWLYRHTPAWRMLATASALWMLTIVATLIFLVPLNNQVAKGGEGWQAAHHTWDRRHRLRIFVLALASLLLSYAILQ